MNRGSIACRWVTFNIVDSIVLRTYDSCLKWDTNTVNNGEEYDWTGGLPMNANLIRMGFFAIWIELTHLRILPILAEWLDELLRRKKREKRKITGASIFPLDTNKG